MSECGSEILAQTDKDVANCLDESLAEQLAVIADVRKALREAQNGRQMKICNKLPVRLAKETGASSWLTARPLHEHGFALHKGAFRDAIALRYGWEPVNLPSYCPC